MNYKVPKHINLTPSPDDDEKFVGMALSRAYLYSHTNIRILSWNDKDCVVYDLVYNQKRINVAVENNVIIKIYGRG